MKLNTKQALKNQLGVELLEDDKPITVGTILGFILSRCGTNSLKSYKLSIEMVNDEVELSDEDVKYITEILSADNRNQGVNFYPIIIGQIISILENK